MRRSIVGMAVLSIAAFSPNLAKADRQEDQEIASRIQQGLLDLKEQGALQGFSIDLQVKDATVWLRGHVSSQAQETKALELARHVSGVRQVVDALDVQLPSAPAPEQAVQLAEQAAQLAEQATAEPAEASIKPRQAPNLLSGLRKLANLSWKSKKGHQDSQVRPVVANEDAPVATPAPAPTAEPVAVEPNRDTEIAQTIISRLQAEKAAGNLFGFNIDLRVTQGDALLNGHVRDEAQHAQVLDIVRRISGVRQVVDGLVLSQPLVATSVSNESRRRSEPAPQPIAESNAAQPLQPVPQSQQLNQEQLVQLQQLQQQQQQQLQQLQAQYAQALQYAQRVQYSNAAPLPMAAGNAMVAPARFDHPQLPGYSWPSYAAHPNYAAVTYPKQYSPAAWPYIGPFYPYPQVPLGWRKVTLQWDDGWWFLDFKDK